MDGLRHRRTPSSERFLGLFSSPPSDSSPSAAAAAGVELHEAEVLWTSSVDAPKPSPRAAATPIQTSGGDRTAALRRPVDRNFGILAALPEDGSSDLVPAAPPILLRKTSISSTSSSTSDSPSSSSSSSTAARMIPTIPKPKPEYSPSMPAARMRQAQSLPVDVPVPPRRARRFDLEASDGPDAEDGQEMMPPHEIVARAYGRASPTTTFSVLEGAGRTLKGRDLRRVRDAVFRQTGFLD
ncbi:protein S40-7-like [Curcuma longa]|uniref:protein S40-7-like n=1 Tax=Curcuma longa TaxID=136217 RepID=UPI003D9E5247